MININCIPGASEGRAEAHATPLLFEKKANKDRDGEK